MADLKPKTFGAGTALAIAAIFSLINLIPFTTKIFALIHDPKDQLAFAQLVVSFFGFLGAIIAFSFAVYQYRKTEKWRRMEFIAREVKEFESDPLVKNALLMIDWGTRKVDLFLDSDNDDEKLVSITRDDQWKALLPDPLKDRETYPEFIGRERARKKAKPDESAEKTPGEIAVKAENEKNDGARFTLVEAKIRDTYDEFLTRLDRFWTFIDAKLIDADELEPFIKYWVEAITKNAKPEKDARWRCVLLTYILYYEYSGVKNILLKYGKDISTDGEIYTAILKSTNDYNLTVALERVMAKPLPPDQGNS